MGFNSVHLGHPSGFKAGFGEGGGFAPPSIWDWTSANAETYWNDLVAVSFDATIYGVTELQYKQAINNLFVDGIDPIRANLFYGLLFRGNSNAQKLIDIGGNAIVPTIGNQPTIQNSGYSFNGTTNYIDGNVVIGTLYPTNEHDFAFSSCKPNITVGGNYALYGVVNGADERSAIMFDGTSLTYLAHSNSSNPNYANVSDEGVYYGIQDGTTTTIYMDKIEKAQALNALGVQGTIEEWIGAVNAGGLAWAFKGQIGCLFRGHDITTTQANNLTDAWNTFVTATNGGF